MALNFGQTDEHAMLADMLRRFLAAENDFEARSQRLGASAPNRLGLWPSLSELGVLAALVPEDVGGFGGTPADMAVVQLALADALLVEPVLTSGVICGRLLQAAGPEAATVREASLTGEAIVSLAFGEGFDPFAPPRTTATALADGYRIEGLKPAVRHADVATHLLIGAQLNGAPALFLLARDTPGLLASNIRLIDGAGAADIRLDGFTAPLASRLDVPDIAAAVTDALEWGLVGLSVETAALVAAANAATFDYLNTRKQFGVALSSFQALQHKAADMAIAAEEAAAMASLAVDSLGEPAEASRSAAILRASLACDVAGRTVAHAAVQLFGGMGVSDELLVSHYARRLAAIRTQIGSMDARAARLSDIEGNAR